MNDIKIDADEFCNMKLEESEKKYFVAKLRKFHENIMKNMNFLDSEFAILKEHYDSSKSKEVFIKIQNDAQKNTAIVEKVLQKVKVEQLALTQKKEKNAATLKSKMEQLQEKKQQLAQLRKGREDLAAHHADQQAKFDQLREVSAKLNEEIAETDVDSLNKQLKEIENDNQIAQEELADASEQLRILNVRQEELKSDEVRLDSDLEAVQMDMSHQKEDLDFVEKKWEGERLKFHQDITELFDDIQLRQKQNINEIAEDLEPMINDLDLIQQNIKDLVDQNAAAKLEVEKLQSEVNLNKATIENLKKEIEDANFEENLQTLQIELDRWQTAHEEARREIENLNDKNQRKAADLERKLKIVQKGNRTKELEIEENKKLEEIEESKKKLEEFKFKKPSLDNSGSYDDDDEDEDDEADQDYGKKRPRKSVAAAKANLKTIEAQKSQRFSSLSKKQRR